MATNKTPPTNRYTAASCHELGFSWVLDAPRSIDAEEIERLHAALVAWSDQPTQDDLHAMLAEEWFCAEHDLSNHPELHKVRIHVTIVHGDRWAQGFSEEG